MRKVALESVREREYRLAETAVVLLIHWAGEKARVVLDQFLAECPEARELTPHVRNRAIHS